MSFVVPVLVVWASVYTVAWADTIVYLVSACALAALMFMHGAIMFRRITETRKYQLRCAQVRRFLLEFVEGGAALTGVHPLVGPVPRVRDGVRDRARDAHGAARATAGRGRPGRRRVALVADDRGRARLARLPARRRRGRQTAAPWPAAVTAPALAAEAAAAASAAEAPAPAAVTGQARERPRPPHVFVPRPPRNAVDTVLAFPFVRLVLAYVLVLWAGRAVVRRLTGPLYDVFDWVAGLFGGAYPPLPYPRLPDALLLIVVPFALYVPYVLLAERRRPSELGGGLKAAAELAAGAALGFGLFALIVAILAVAGAYEVLGTQSWTVLQWSAAAAAVSVREEIVFRGIVLRISEERLGTWLALLLSSLWFGLVHMDNPNAGLWEGLAIAVFAGPLLGACYLATRRLWLAIGAHALWNLAEGGIFGTTVSGYEVPGILVSRMSGPEWLSGGAFGPEASWVTLGVTLTASAILLAIAARRGYLRPPRLRRRLAPDGPWAGDGERAQGA
ncbi:MAG: CPBP family intramembrane metalloprotease [Actinomycetota bacterium]|nr:MAG: CPBP family intramembrane metalloprotease [Actinomycetota bacterium]